MAGGESTKRVVRVPNFFIFYTLPPSMPLNDILESLVGHSANVASVNLSKPSERVSNYLIPSQPKHKKLVRDAESYECKLFSLGGNEQAVARYECIHQMQQDCPSIPY